MCVKIIAYILRVTMKQNAVIPAILLIVIAALAYVYADTQNLGGVFRTPTLTNTATLTVTPTFTATSTFTATATHIATPTATPTSTPTNIPMPEKPKNNNGHDPAPTDAGGGCTDPDGCGGND
jgi:hypothetical protein